MYQRFTRGREIVRAWGRGLTAAEFIIRRGDSGLDIYPSDATSGVVPGESADRILVLGEGIAVGMGVLTHELAIAAQFARQHASVTGRGAEWASVEVPGFRVRRTVEAIDADRLRFCSTDVVVLMIGVTDTLMLTSRARWRREMTATLDAVLERIPVDAHVLVTDIPPMENAGSISRAGRMAAGHQARMLNAITHELVEARPRCTTVPFPPHLRGQLWRPEGQQVPYAGLFAAWAQELCLAWSVPAANRRNTP